MPKDTLTRMTKDFLFKKLSIEKGLDYALESGWYDDFYTKNENIIDPYFEFNITPTLDVEQLKYKDKPIVVLIASGSYNPPHKGHVDSMKQAEEYMTSLGYNVVSYFSPSHDMYVSKKKGASHIPAAERIELLNGMGVNVCPWESMFLEGDVIFTEVVMRLHKLLTLKHKVKIKHTLFVCGSDIPSYIRPFENVKGLGALLIKRPGHEKEFYENKEKYETKDNSNGLFFFDSKDPIKESSSNLIENGYSNKGLKNKVNVRVRENNSFDQGMVEIIKEYFDVVETYEIKENGTVRDYVGVDILENNKTISMDKFTKGDVNISFSRIYDYFGMKWFGFEEKLISGEITPGYYTLFDDDSASGYMMNEVTKNLELIDGVVIQCQTTHIKHDPEYETIDAYDFDFSCDMGGLKVGSLGRLPYIIPFVNPTSRCSINRPFEFSKKVVELNKQFDNTFRVRKPMDNSQYQITLKMVEELLNKLEKVEKKYIK